jgi:hypothetical protein
VITSANASSKLWLVPISPHSALTQNNIIRIVTALYTLDVLEFLHSALQFRAIVLLVLHVSTVISFHI